MNRLIKVVENNSSVSSKALNVVLPVIQALLVKTMNPYTSSKVSTAECLEYQRTHFANLIPRNVIVGQPQLVQCMISGVFGDGKQVIAAHLIPCKTDPLVLDLLNLKLTDVNSMRNILFLSKNIEVAFDRLKLSFVPQDLLHPNTLVMKVWDQSITDSFIFDDSTVRIGDLEGRPLLLGSHQPFLRCLSSQALFAWQRVHCSGLTQDPRPEPFGSPEGKSILEQHRVAMKVSLDEADV